jgi:hypothetical protein
MGRGSYVSDGRSTSWLKIKNSNYTQIPERDELFERRGGRSAGQKAPASAPVCIL